MDNEKIKEILKNKKEIFIFKIDLVTKTYVQAVKLKSNKIQFIYYQIENDELHEVQDEDKLKFLREKYEQEPSSILYEKIREDRSEYQKRYRIKQDNSEQQENLDLKPWVKDYIKNELQKCELFTSVYGKKYPERKIQDLKNVYVKERNGRYAIGECELSKKIINIYLETRDDEYYSILDLKNSEKMLSTILHEGIHHVLRYSDTRSGIFTSIPVINKDVNLGHRISSKNIGRALNEGFTEWIVEKAGHGGYVSKEYQLYLNIIKQIELAIGSKNTMKLGDCEFFKIRNIKKLLK